MRDLVVVGGVFREIHDADNQPVFRMGGSGLVAAVVAARLGAATTLLSYVGSDDEDMVRLMLLDAGVEEQIFILPGASGTFLFATHQDNASVPWPMYRPAEATPTTVPALPQARAYLLFGIPDFDPVQAGWLNSLPADAYVVWDQQGWLSRAADSRAVGALPSGTKLYLANTEEASMEFDETDPQKLLQLMPPPGFQTAILKSGAKGATLITETNAGKAIEDVRGFPLREISTIGSGDAFAGALVASILSRAPLRRCVLIANAAASCFLRSGGRTDSSFDLLACTDALLDGVDDDS